jgi:hypothetical protein
MGFFVYRGGPGGGRRRGGFGGCLLWSIVLSVVLTIVLNLVIRAF